MSEFDPADESVREASSFVPPLLEELEKVLVGQKYLVERLLIGLLTNGHVLLEGVPGLAKTLAVKSLASCLNVRFSRIQFTPDMLPADVSGTQVFHMEERRYSIRKGPVFANLVLADEINRAPAKVQSALLEAMQERQVTLGDETLKLEEPFLVLATQNPVEHEGTYPLPEAQLDRFLLKIRIDYPNKKEERLILDRMARTSELPQLVAVASREQILEARNVINDIHVDDRIKDYIVDLICATRDPKEYKIDAAHLIELGASPRGTISLTLASKAHAFLNGRGYVTPQDVKSVAMDVLRHRVAVTFEAEARNLGTDDVISKILDEVPVP